MKLAGVTGAGLGEKALCTVLQGNTTSQFLLIRRERFP